MTFVGPTLALLAFVIGLTLLRAADARKQRLSLTPIDLRFPRDQDEDGVRAFLGSISGLLPPWWRRWWHTPFVVSEIHANRTGTRHRLLVPQRFVRHIEGALAAHLPNVAYDIGGSFAYPALTVGSTVFCARCQRRLGFLRATGRASGKYDYFFCLGRQTRNGCDLPYLPTSEVEEAMTGEWGDIELGPAVSEKVRDQMLAALKRSTGALERERSLQQKRVKQLENERRRLVRAHLEGAIPVDLLKNYGTTQQSQGRTSID